MRLRKLQNSEHYLCSKMDKSQEYFYFSHTEEKLRKRHNRNKYDAKNKSDNNKLAAHSTNINTTLTKTLRFRY